MELNFSKKNRTLIAKITGEIDHHTCEILRLETERALDRMGGKNIIFQMEGVIFMDSSGIGAMIGRYKYVQRLGGRVAIAAANKTLERIFQLSAMETLIPSFPDLDKAVAFVEGGVK